MKNLSFILALLSLISLAFTDPVSPQPKMVLNVFRHGARGPVYDLTGAWGREAGQLTAVGMRMHYLLGVALKDRYPTLLSTYDPARIILRSTDVNRTIMSVYSQLFGVYGGTGPALTGEHSDVLSIPPYADYDSNNTMRNLTKDAALPNKFQVLPFHVDSASSGKLLTGMSGCPNSGGWSAENNNDEESTNIFKTELADVTKALRDAGMKADNIVDLFKFGDTAIANKAQNIALPGKIAPDSQHYLDLKFATEWQFFKAYGTGKNEAALHSFYLLHGIKDYINSYFNKTSPANFAFLSGHDSTLMPVLIAFNITTKDCLLENYQNKKAGKPIRYENCVYPGFASNIVFEVYGETAEEATVKFYYNNVQQPICGKATADETCSYKELVSYISQVTKNYSFEDYNTKCGILAAEIPTIILSTYAKVNFMLGMTCILLLIGVLFACASVKKQDVLLKKDSEQTRSLLSTQL